jgi:hypothetical protein
MSSGIRNTGAPPTNWAHVAACEAQGAHRDTGEILKLLQEGSEEADPIATILDGQDRASRRQTQIFDLLRKLDADLQAVRAEQLRQAEEIAVLRRESGETHGKLIRASVTHHPPVGSPR